MNAAIFIAGDWGTTHLRLSLCDEAGKQLASKLGPGALEVHGEFASTFDSLTSDWMEQSRDLSAILCGMVGSSIGWVQTRYVPSPVNPPRLATECVALRDGRVRIVPGLSCRNRLSAPDLMRGEETQVLGALQLDHELRQGRHLLCLPGTHTKWVVIEDGSITEFLTAPAGELFALICRYSVLVQSGSNATADAVEFDRGLAAFASQPRAQLLHRIFQCRSRWMTGDLAGESTASYLSGLLIASDVDGAMELFATSSKQPVRVIGSAELSSLYSRALAAVSREARCIDGEAAALAGLTHLYLLLRRNANAT